MIFLVTIDTEEDQWTDYSRNKHTLKNIHAVPRLQEMFARYQVKPSYLISYAVTTDQFSTKLFKKLQEEQQAEIGAHCHPWNTPPFDEELNSNNTMLCNLPAELQYLKLLSLTEIIEEKIGRRPVAFRAGRWGYSSVVAEQLLRLGYKVETSMTPFVNWECYSGPDLSKSPTQPFFFKPEQYLHGTGDPKGLLEVPVTIGFNRQNFNLCHFVYEYFGRNALTRKFVIGGLSRLFLLRKAWLSPELSSANDMISLIKVKMKRGEYVFNMMFHSNSLYPGNSPFVHSDHDLDSFFKKIEDVLLFAVDIGCRFMTLSEYRDSLDRC